MGRAFGGRRRRARQAGEGRRGYETIDAGERRGQLAGMASTPTLPATPEAPPLVAPEANDSARTRKAESKAPSSVASTTAGEAPTKAPAAPEPVSPHVRAMLDALLLDERLSAIEAQIVEARKHKALAASISGPFSRQLRPYTAGFALIGFTLGVFAGWSSTPVVATILPLIFGLLGGAGGLYLAQADLGSPRTRILGVTMSLFAGLTLLGACIGVSMRTRTGIVDMMPRLLTAPVLPTVAQTSPMVDVDARLALAVLRARLVTLAVPPPERDQILADASLVLSSPRARTVDFHKSAARLKAAADTLSRVAGTTNDVLPSELRRQSALLAEESNELEAWSKTPLREVYVVAMQARIADILGTLRDASHSLSPSDAEALRDLKAAESQFLVDRAANAPALAPSDYDLATRRVDAVALPGASAAAPMSIPMSAPAETTSFPP